MSHKKEAIIEAFVQLLDEKPVKRITVNDIATRCGIGRNTFYYYFPNIPAIYDAMEEQWMDSIRKCTAPQSIIDCVAPLVDYAAKHRSGFLYVFRTADRTRFENDLSRLWSDIVDRYLEQAVKQTVSESDRAVMHWCFKCAFVGMTIDWLNADMSYDLVADVRRTCELVSKGGIEKF